MTGSGDGLYTAELGAGLGLIPETKALLELWESGMSKARLNEAALESGRFPNVTARRLKNIVDLCFAPRYLVRGGAPATHLKRLAPALTPTELQQFFLLFTARANTILGDFVREVYWPRYAGGYSEVTNDDARAFVERAIDRGMTSKRWSEPTVRRVAAYLTGCCADYGLLDGRGRTRRRIQPLRLSHKVAAYLAFDLHFAGVGDNALLGHDDWRLFGLERGDAVEEMRRLALRGLLIIQAAGEVVKVSWKHPDMEALCDALAQG